MGFVVDGDIVGVRSLKLALRGKGESSRARYSRRCSRKVKIWSSVAIVGASRLGDHVALLHRGSGTASSVQGDPIHADSDTTVAQANPPERGHVGRPLRCKRCIATMDVVAKCN